MSGDVQQCVRQDRVLLEAVDENVPLPLGQFITVFVQQQGQMSESGRLPPQSPVHEEVFGR